MTQIAGPESILAPFDGVKLEHSRDSVVLERRGDDFIATFLGDPTSRPIERKIELTTGSHHFQVYWTTSGKGRELELFPFAYQIAEQRWIESDHLVLADPEIVELDSVWNRHCIQCHSTAGKPMLLSGSATEVGEFGIACEACHGPAQRHVEFNRNPQRRYQLHLSEGPDQSIVNPARLPHDRSSEICGQCHSVNTFYSKQDTQYWSEKGFPYRPGDALGDTRKVFHNDTDSSIAGESSFWSDDMVRVNGREYNSLLKTPCFQRGELSCLSCHQMHQATDDTRSVDEWAEDQLGVAKRDNAACVQCHASFADDQRLAQHTHHRPDSPGSSCYDCHMPHTAYGLHKATRSHQISSPSVATELQTTRPNACNLCHLDQSIGWAAGRLEAWYGIEAPKLSDAQTHLAAGVVWSLSGDAGVRALAGWHMGWGPAKEASGTDWLPPYLAELLIDGYPTVRSVASRSLRVLPGYEDIETPFEASASARRATKQRILDTWSEGRNKAAPANYRLLMDEGQILDRSLFGELRRRRDRRFVWLVE
ncbi:MAG: multiheme c-type cytochrome [Myxococcota bacterium]